MGGFHAGHVLRHHGSQAGQEMKALSFMDRHGFDSDDVNQPFERRFGTEERPSETEVPVEMERGRDTKAVSARGMNG